MSRNFYIVRILYSVNILRFIFDVKFFVFALCCECGCKEELHIRFSCLFIFLVKHAIRMPRMRYAHVRHSLSLKVCRLWELFALRAHDSIVAFLYYVISFMCFVCAEAPKSGTAYILQSHTHRTFCP